MFSRIAFARFSSASPIFGKAILLEHAHRDPKRTSVQIISPRPGETRKLPPFLLGRVLSLRDQEQRRCLRATSTA